MMRSAPSSLAAMTPDRPTAPSPTTTAVEPDFTSAALAAYHPVPMTSDRASRSGISSSGGCSGVQTRVPSARGMRTYSAWAPFTHCACRRGGLVAELAHRAGVVGSDEGADDELARPDARYVAADLFDYADVLVADRLRFGNRQDTPVAPQVGAAHAGGYGADDCVCR